jgi:hypothetical protein
MAEFKASALPEPIVIKKWLGINQSVAETQLRIGEATKQVNYRITQDYLPQKRQGHVTFVDFVSGKVQGLWYGTIKNKKVMIICHQGKVYEYDMTADTTTTAIANLITEKVVKEIGSITDTKTTIFFFNSKLLFINGTDYNYYNGTTYGTVESIAYVPTLFKETPPAGGGSEYEQANLLTGRKKQEFRANGTARDYFIVEKNIDSNKVLVKIDGTTKTENSHFTVDRAKGKITFNSAPAAESLVIIEWTKVESGNADLVKKNKYAMLFGAGNDTSIFLWGNVDAKNRRTWSGTLKENYWPVFNFTLIGSDQYAITDIKPQYSRQIIFKEDRTHYSYAEYVNLTNAYDYPVFDLNEKVGNVAFNQVQVVENSPISIKAQSWWQWQNTNVEDERNAQIISERLRQSLQHLDLTKAITFDYQKEKEYWCNVDGIVYIWNYGNNTMYTYDNIQATTFLNVNNTVFFGTHNGTIERFKGTNDNEKPVNAMLEIGFNALDTIEYKKNTRRCYVAIKPFSQSSLRIYYRTNRMTEWREVNKSIEYRILDFSNINFKAFSFLTNINPQSRERKLRAKKYTHVQFKFVNAELNEQCVLTNFKFQAELQGVI